MSEYIEDKVMEIEDRLMEVIEILNGLADTIHKRKRKNTVYAMNLSVNDKIILGDKLMIIDRIKNYSFNDTVHVELVDGDRSESKTYSKYDKVHVYE